MSIQTRAVTCFTAALILFAGSNNLSQAGNFSLVADITAAFDNATEFNPIAIPDTSSAPGFSAVYQIDVSVVVDDLEAGEAGVASIAYIPVFGNLTDELGYQPSTEQVDTNGPAPGGSAARWATNQPAGAGILTAIQGGLTNPSDPRLSAGQGGPTLLGKFFVTWDGVSDAVFTAENVQFSAALEDGRFGLELAGQGPNLNFVGVPEPTALALAGISLVGFVARRRRS